MSGDGGGAMLILGFLVLMMCAVGVCAGVCLVLRCFGHGDADNSSPSCSPARAQVLARSNPYLQPVLAPPPQQVTIINNHYYAPQPAAQPITPRRMPDMWPDGEPVEVWPDVKPARWPS